MSSKEKNEIKFSYFMVIECMMEPLRQKFKSSDTLTAQDVTGNLQNVEAIVHMITATSQASALSSDALMSNQAWDHVIVTFIIDVCLPILRCLHIIPDSSKKTSEKVKVRSVAVHSISSCFQHIKDEKTLCEVIFQILSPFSSLNTQREEIPAALRDPGPDHAENHLDTCSALELFNAVLSDETTMTIFLSGTSHFGCEKEMLLKHFFHSAITASEGDRVTFSKSLSSISKLVTFCPAVFQANLLSEIWQRFTQPLERDLSGNVTKESLWQTLFAFYCFQDLLFPLEKSQCDTLAQHLGDEFWISIQAGLLSIEPSHRKLSMYLLKRLVDTCQQNDCSVNIVGDSSDHLETAPMFWWHKEQSGSLSGIWEDFILLMETLEEKQVHVIKPVLSRMEKLIGSYSTPSRHGLFPLHTSWLRIIFIRCFNHESHYMSRWGAVTLLTLDFCQVPLIKQGLMKFLSQDVLDYVQENKLYSRYTDTEIGKCSPVGEALVQFFAKLCTSMDRKNTSDYLNNVLQKIIDNQWGSIPMLFLTQGLSNIPPAPIFGVEGLRLIRDVLQTCLTTHEPQSRAAIQCFLGQMLINLLDLNSISLTDLFTTLASLNRDESFRRGISLWERVKEYLMREDVSARWDDMVVLIAASEYLSDSKNRDEKCSTIYNGSQVVALSKMLLLFADASVSSAATGQERTVLEKSPLGVILIEMQSTASNVLSRSYMSASRIDACLAVLRCLGKEIGNVDSTDHVGMFVKARLGQSFQFIASFVTRRLSQDLTKPQDLDEIKFYSDVILTLGSHCPNPLMPLQDLLKFVAGAFDLTLKDTANPGIDMISASAMKVFQMVLRIVQTNDFVNDTIKDAVRKKISEMKSIHSLPLPFSKAAKSEESFSKAQVGYVISSFLSSKWQCQKLMLELMTGRLRQTVVPDLEALLERSMEDMTLGSGNSDIGVFGALELLVEQATTECPSLVPNVLDLAWRKVMEEKKNVFFWRKLEALVRLTLQGSLLDPQVDVGISTVIDEFTEKMYDLGQEKSGVFYLVVKHLCESSLRDDADRKKAERMIPVLLQACDFGPIHKRWQRSWLDVMAYIEGLGPALASNQITNTMAKNDVSSRIVVLNWLSELKPTVPADRRFALTFLRDLSDKYLELAESTAHKQFTNSLAHRQKHRLILVLTFLSDFIEEAECGEFLSKLKAGLELENHPSVTHNLEWIMMRLFIRYPSYLTCLWDYFSQFSQRRSTCLCSLFLIACQIGPKLPKNSQLDFYSQAFPTAMPWTMAHHYSTRIFAQTTITCLWQQCSTLQLDQLLDKFSLVKTTVEFLRDNNNASNTVAKLQDNFILAGFDPIRDFSAETIFHTLPRLALISDDEWISPSQLSLHDRRWQEEGGKSVPLINASSILAGCKEGPWKVKAYVGSDDDITKKMHGDVQKKIMPWRQMSPNDEMENELATNKHKKTKDGLILVTSLIDKPPNLGGLCRTSEIFGVSEFVIGSQSYLDDKMFQSLSVSAEKWLSISEVIKPKLPDYLAMKRREGYTLVGVEQTANSVSLDEYTFPKKSLLVLGNEKEGIPPDMIQTLDVCVEIPQRGIIRSLNVHVCGALIVWEYTRQHLMDCQEVHEKDGLS